MAGYIDADCRPVCIPELSRQVIAYGREEAGVANDSGFEAMGDPGEAIPELPRAFIPHENAAN